MRPYFIIQEEHDIYLCQFPSSKIIRAINLSDIMDNNIYQYLFTDDLTKLVLSVTNSKDKDIVCVYDLNSRKIIQKFYYDSISQITVTNNKIYFRSCGYHPHWVIIDLDTFQSKSFDSNPGQYYNLPQGQYIFLDDGTFLSIFSSHENNRTSCHSISASFSQKTKEAVWCLTDGSTEVHCRVVKDNLVAVDHNIHDIRRLKIFRFDNENPKEIFAITIGNEIKTFDFSETHLAVFDGKLKVYSFDGNICFESKHFTDMKDIKIIDRNHILFWQMEGEDHVIGILNFSSDVIKCEEHRYIITSIDTLKILN